MVRALGDGIPVGAEEERRIKVPPHSVEAEQSLLGGLMLDKTAWDKIADIVGSEDFYRKDHKVIFKGIAELIETGNPCDVVTLSEFLDKRGELDTAGGLEYLATLANETPKSATRLQVMPFRRAGAPRRMSSTKPNGWCSKSRSAVPAVARGSSHSSRSSPRPSTGSTCCTNPTAASPVYRAVTTNSTR